MNVDELMLLRRLALDEPADADAARAEVWRRLNGGDVQASDRRPDGRTRLPPRRVFAIAAMIAVAGLLVAPALAIGDRILELIDGKSNPRDVQTPAWSPDGRKLAFVSQRDGNSEIYVMNADGSGQRRLTWSEGDDTHPSWSPDGRQLVFDSNRDGIWNLYVMEAGGGAERRLTHRGASADSSRDYARHPSWSPDGRRIAFDSDRDGNEEVYVVDADGSRPTRVTNHPGSDNHASWTPDGTSLLLSSTTRTSQPGIGTVADPCLTGSIPRPTGLPAMHQPVSVCHQ